MHLIHLDDYVVALDQNISTEQTITGEVVHAVLDAHVTEHLGHLKLMLGVAAGLNSCCESLHAM